MEGICLCPEYTPGYHVLSEHPSSVFLHSRNDCRRKAVCHSKRLGRFIPADPGIWSPLGKKTDRDVVGQYLQHPKIAKDFANYLELYYKYPGSVSGG